MKNISELYGLIAPSLFIEMNRRAEIAKTSKLDFAHFTNTESALKILKSNELWLRSPLRMNDYSEVKAGFTAIDLGLSKTLPSANKFWREFGKVFPDFEVIFSRLYQSAYRRVPKATYISSFSEFPKDDLTGRLSMWRAYGFPNGVALIINGDEMLSQRQHMDVLSYPVRYLDHGKVILNLEKELESLIEKLDDLSQFSALDVATVLVELLCHIAISTKHFAFAEEAEWRIIYREETLERGILSNAISTLKPEVIGGCPEIICSLPLGEDRQVSLKRVLKKVLIGPTEFPEDSKRALIEHLRQFGYVRPESLVECSNIPFRG